MDCSVSCPHRSHGPVCGTNGRTYRSLCELDLDICRNVKVVLKHEGECTCKCPGDGGGGGGGGGGGDGVDSFVCF